jgi:hypothetical protein
VLAATAGSGDACGAVADCCCPYINFHADPRAADAHRTAHPSMDAELLSQAEALEAARRIFGGLLDPDAGRGPVRRPQQAADHNDPER